MKLFVIVGAVLLNFYLSEAKIIVAKVGIPPAGPPDSRAAQPEWGAIMQRVDHFDPTDNRMWRMRFMQNKQYFKPGGPMFIFLGGEWAISPGYLQTGQMFDIAKEHNGYMFYTEHRFYGRSFPINDLTSESLKYLSVDQALADVAYFITNKKATIPGLENSKVVVVGASYSANMATWSRIKYPHLIHAAIASSAPVNATEEYHGYYGVTSDNIKLNSQRCWDTINEATNEMEVMLQTTEGVNRLTSLLNYCVPIKTYEPYRSYLFNSVGALFGNMVQYAYPGQIKAECDWLLGFPGNSLDKLTGYIRAKYNGYCMGDYDEFLASFNNTNITGDIYRQWFYQTCTEFGFHQTTDYEPFGKSHLSMFQSECKDLFGDAYTPDVIRRAVERTNLMNGGLNLKVTKVVSIHGTVDPWHAAGILKDLSPMAPAFLINGTAHCADLTSMSPSDIPAMYEAKRRTKELIAEWIK